ncbi:hypothetical protein P4S73_29065 [Paraglaciecola sp. Hal342]
MLAIKEVTKLAAGLNTIAPFMREIHNDNELEQALELMEALIEDYDTNLVVIEALGMLSLASRIQPLHLLALIEA